MNVFLLVVLITLIGVLIGGFAFLVGLGKSIEAGGNISNAFSVFDKKRKDEQSAEKDDDVSHRKTPNQFLRTIGGVLFGVLMLLCPILYGERVSGAPFISLNHQYLKYLVASLVVCGAIIFLAMWIAERKPK